MRRRTIFVLTTALVTSLVGPQTYAQVKSCGELAKFSSPSTVIESAEIVTPGSAAASNRPLPPFMANLNLPEYCKVRGNIDARTGSDGATYAINFELNLPARWNGKFLFQGGGGLDGTVGPAIGMAGMGTPPALARGYAVVSMDGGHQGADNSSFGREQQARLDYAYTAIGTVTRTAKAILTSYYGKPEEHSYFMGCSNGGREAMIAVQRYPLDFDGAVAGDPGFHLSYAAIEEAWDTETFLSVAPSGDDGTPILSKAFSQSDLDTVRDAVLKQCDKLDGIEDGEINNFQACHFDPAVLICDSGNSSKCLTKKQVEALKRLFGGARDSSGRQIYPGWIYDAGINGRDWRGWKLGTSETPKPNALNATMGAAALKDYFVHPYISGLNTLHLDYDKIADEVAETYAINDPVSTDIGTFARRGGRLIIYEGLSDPVFSAADLIDYYNRFTAAVGGVEKAQSEARLFLVPGMNHCQGGPSTDQFNVLDALEQWVEKGNAPASLMASGRAFPNRTRPLCPYPEYASYKGSGDPESAANFTCVTQ